MKYRPLLVSAIFATSCFDAVANAKDLFGQAAPADATFLKAEHIPSPGRLVRAYRVKDQEGEHVLVLSRKEGPSPALSESGRVERIDLAAGFFTRIGKGN